jgi:hypothetical protein
MDRMHIFLQRVFRGKLPADCTMHFPALLILQPVGSFQLADFDGGILKYIQKPQPWICTSSYTLFQKANCGKTEIEDESPGAPSNEMDRLQTQVVNILSDCPESAVKIELYFRKV